MSVVQADGPGTGVHPGEPSGTVVMAVVVVAASVVIVAGLAILVHRGVGDWRFDRRVLHVFRRQHSPFVRESARGLADLATIQSLLVIAVLIAFGLRALRLRPVLCAVPLVSLLVTGCIVQLVKLAIPRSSPNTYFRMGSVGGGSFPSGHAADTTALAIGLAIVLAVALARRPGERVALFAVAAVVSIAAGLSRLVLGVHWPTDVLAGWAIGLGTAVAIGTLGVLAADGRLVPTLHTLLAAGTAVTTALVTGASGGIGLELARALAADHDLVLVARSDARLREVALELGGARVIALDLAEPDAVAQLVAAVPDVDVLVNNAGVGDFARFAEADPAKLDTVVALNIGALTRLSRAYLPGMLRRGEGRILNVASTAAFQPGPLMAVYYATKAYVLSFSEALAEETRGSGVTVTALCPGPTASGFQAGAAMEGSRLVKGRKLPTAASVAAYGVAAMRRGDVVAVPGLMNKLFASSIRFTPRAVVRRVVHRMQRAG